MSFVVYFFLSAQTELEGRGNIICRELPEVYFWLMDCHFFFSRKGHLLDFKIISIPFQVKYHAAH